MFLDYQKRLHTFHSYIDNHMINSQTPPWQTLSGNSQTLGPPERHETAPDRKILEKFNDLIQSLFNKRLSEEEWRLFESKVDKLLETLSPSSAPHPLRHPTIDRRLSTCPSNAVSVKNNMTIKSQSQTTSWKLMEKLQQTDLRAQLLLHTNANSVSDSTPIRKVSVST